MRAGVFLCECGGNISGVVDLEPLAEHARGLAGVVEVNINQFMCGTEGRAMIEKAVEERGLDHFVIASCSPRFQGPTFERIARELKLGENAVAFGNIREGCSFVHAQEPERAQVKAKKIVEGAVARLQHMSDLPRRRTFLNRSVLVVGGGIAGISAAEELADAGIEVHLVERQQSIGGYMSRLSKTFPTEDCAMCSLAPRLTNAATDSRIHIHALSDVTAVTGPPGEFNVTVRHRPRYVNEKCVGCGECAAVCPVTYPNEFDFGVAERTAISRPFANAVPATFAVERRGWSPCKTTCPVHTSAHGYVALVAKGRYEEAYRVASEPNPFPSVCGRICTHVCETECTRGDVDEPVAIAGIKRFVADNGAPAEPPAPLPVFYDEPVAIVGGGPAGLTAARELAQFGYKATVFEALPVAGGMLRVGIPEYRLPRPALQGEVDRITALGVELKTGVRCGTDFTVDSLFADGYKAVFLATGLHQSKDLPIEGLDQQGVVRAVEFLRAQALGEHPTTGKRVVVVGGGDVAYDAGRTAFRCGADEVTLACIEDERTAPASSEEIEEGKEEQVAVEYSLMPVEILGTGGAATGVKFQRCTLGEPNERGWRPPVPVEGEFVELEADTVIFAVGQAIVDDFLAGADDVAVERGQIQVDPDTMMTGRTGVFAGGDAAAMGPWTAIEAVAAGRRGARAIHNFLRGEQLVPGLGLRGRQGQDPAHRARAARAAGATHHEDPRRRRAPQELGGGPPRLQRGGRPRRGRALPRLRRVLRLQVVRHGLPRRRHRLRPEALGRGAHRRRHHPGHRPSGVRRHTQAAARLRTLQERAHAESAGSAAVGLRADRGRAPAPLRRRHAQAHLHAAVRRLARLHEQRQRALLGHLLPLRHAAQLADQAALPGRGDHHRLHRHAHARQGARGVLPPRAGARRALRARPRRRDPRGARRQSHGAPGEHHDRRQERGAVRPRRALAPASRVPGARRTSPASPASRPRPPASSASSTPSFARWTRSGRACSCAAPPRDPRRSPSRSPRRRPRRPVPSAC